jgi:hypothetical protein
MHMRMRWSCVVCMCVCVWMYVPLISHREIFYDRDQRLRPRSSQSWGALSPVASHLSKVLGHNAPKNINPHSTIGIGIWRCVPAVRRVGTTSPVAITVLGHNSPKIHHYNIIIIIIINQCHPWQLPGSCLEAAQQLPGSCPSAAEAARLAAAAACPVAAWKLSSSCLGPALSARFHSMMVATSTFLKESDFFCSCCCGCCGCGSGSG